MTEQETQPGDREPGSQQTAENQDEARVSEKVPEELSGDGKTPLGDTDQHSDAPGPDGLG